MRSSAQGVERGLSNRVPARSIGGNSAVTRATLATCKWIVDEDPSPALMGVVRSLLTAQSDRLFDNVRMMSLYANSDFMSQFFKGGSQGNVAPEPQVRMSDNQVKKHVDTLVGKLLQANSRIKMMTSNGDITLWKKARKRENALAGEWARMQFFRHAQRCCIDGIVTGTGIIKFYESDDGKKVECQRVFPNEVFVDDVEAACGPPLKMYQVRYVARDTLTALYPDKERIIMQAKPAQPPNIAWTQYSPGMLEIVEAWALPVGKRKGRHVICTAGGSLVDEEWTSTRFPFVFFRPCDSLMGWYGQGLVCQVESAQTQLNAMLQIMEEGARLAIAPFWVVTEGSNINLRHLDTVPGHIIETAGAEPKWITNAPFHQAAPVYCQMLRQEIADMFGNNQMDTGGEPSIDRLDSKRALKEFQNMGASRITTILERWSNDVFIDASMVTMDMAMRIAKKKGAYPVLVQESLRKVVQLDWRDLDMDADAYLCQPAPANMMSSNPAARLDQLTELMQAGLITQKQAQRQMQGPRDIDAILSEATATEEDIDDLIEGFVEEGTYRAPTSLQDLQRGLARVADAYLLNRIRGLEPERLQLFIRWLEEAQDTLLQLTSQAPTTPGVIDAPQAAGPVPGAAPGAADLGQGPTGATAPAAQVGPPPGPPGAVPSNGPVIA